MRASAYAGRAMTDKEVNIVFVPGSGEKEDDEKKKGIEGQLRRKHMSVWQETC